MKIATILIFAACLHVSARSVAQGISLSLKDAPIERAFESIEKQCGYHFMYRDEWVKQAARVNIQIRNASLAQALELCFKDQPLTYSLIGQLVVVKLKPGASPGQARDATFFKGMKIEGRVVNEKGEGLGAATVVVRGSSGSNYVIKAAGGGGFDISLPDSSAELEVSYIGYKTKVLKISGDRVNITIQLEPAMAEMKGVEVVSTGYETIARDRASGSFEKVNKALLNRGAGSTVLDRLEGIVPGILFDRRQLPAGAPGLDQMTIRGLSTLESNKHPLIVLDNVPYEGDVNNINPNDIESITILKDAAAASIWGVRAGNGVIVIVTRKGNYERPLQVSLTTNLIMSDKPDLFQLKAMKPSDFVDVEKYLFSKGRYDYVLSDNYFWSPVMQVTDLLGQARDGVISQAQADAQIDAFRNHDVRNDYLKYVYRKAVTQQYALDVSGGTQNFNYILSGGYDKQTGETIREVNQRITFRTAMNFKPVKNLEIQSSTIFTQSRLSTPGGDVMGYLHYDPSLMTPYTRLVDDQGRPAVVTRDYRASFAANPGDPRLLDWQFRPLAELDAGRYRNNMYDILLNLGATYHISKALSANITYNYQRTIGESNDYEGPDAYSTRNLINLYTQAPGSLIERPVPLGGILNAVNSNASFYLLRGGLNLNKSWGRHQVTGVAGAELSDKLFTDNSRYVYGYDLATGASQPVDNLNYYGGYTLPQGGGILPNGIYFTNNELRFTDLYASAAYTYNGRYTVTGSARKDASNLFGVTPNKRGVPLWSVGGVWDVAKEGFYKSGLLPVLRFRASYGYNGNTNNDLSAHSSIVLRQGNPFTNVTYASILNPDNDQLRWEKVGIFNLGLDFGFRNNRVSGKVEYFVKRSTDLLWQEPLGLSTGFYSATTNSVAMVGHGLEISLHSNNLTGAVKWTTDVSFTRNTNKVTKYTPLTTAYTGDYLSGAGSIVPIVGQPLYSVYSYKWAGLDPQTGDPRGYVDAKISTDYTTIDFDSVKNLQFHGSAVPQIYGNFTNTVSWRNFSLSANILYSLDYYFTRSSIDYSSLMSSFHAVGHADYAQRWQKPGDEKTTNVPSMIYPDNYYRDLFYARSAALVTKGDLIRLQDIIASYSFPNPTRYFKNISVSAKVMNLGLIWRANKEGIDPQYGSGSNPPAPKAYSIGLNANF